MPGPFMGAACGSPPSVLVGSFVRVMVCLAAAAIAWPDTMAEAQVTPFAPTYARLVRGNEPAPIPPVTVVPAILVLPPGAVQRFTAVVSGTANPITWTATGGTITTDGT